MVPHEWAISEIRAAPWRSEMKRTACSSWRLGSSARPSGGTRRRTAHRARTARRTDGRRRALRERCRRARKAPRDPPRRAAAYSAERESARHDGSGYENALREDRAFWRQGEKDSAHIATSPPFVSNIPKRWRDPSPLFASITTVNSVVSRDDSPVSRAYLRRDASNPAIARRGRRPRREPGPRQCADGAARRPSPLRRRSSPTPPACPRRLPAGIWRR